MMILHLYSLQTFISHQNRQCHHSRNHHWHRWLLTSSCFAWSGQPCRMHHLVDFSSLPQDLFKSTPHGFVKSHCVTVWLCDINMKDNIDATLQVKCELSQSLVEKHPNYRLLIYPTLLISEKVTGWLCHCVTWIWRAI